MFLFRARISACLLTLVLALMVGPTTFAFAQGQTGKQTETKPRTTATDPKDPYGEKQRLPDLADSADRPKPGSTGGSLVRTVIGLAVVIAVIYGLTWVMRQLKASREDRQVGDGLAIAATVPLSSGRSVHLVRAGSEYVLVGSAESGVTPLRTYSEQEAYELGLLADDEDKSDDRSGHTGVRLRVAGMFTALAERLRERTLR